MIAQDISNIMLGLNLLGVPIQGANYTVQVIKATNGQTILPISIAPNVLYPINITINQVVQAQNSFTYAFPNITLSTPLTVNDIVEISYYY